MSASTKWKRFERLVTAIHQTVDQGAEVQWDEKINGRQFDVTVRFRKGLYNYLTVIECKDYATPVPVDKVDGLVTKARDAHADHAVMASTSGFQEGAREVAARHNVTLIHVTDAENIDLSFVKGKWLGTIPCLRIETVELEYTDGTKHMLPEAANALTYYVNHIILNFGGGEVNLDGFLEPHLRAFLDGEPDAYRDESIDCFPGTVVTAPKGDEIPLWPLRRVHVRAGMTTARLVTGPVKFDPYLLAHDIAVKNLSTGEEQTFNPHSLALGIKTVFTEDAYYEASNLPGWYYYCEKIRDGLATLHLVESFQNGSLIQVSFTAPIKNASFYLPLSDEKLIGRLRRRLASLGSATS
jgi:hypothetical protein